MEKKERKNRVSGRLEPPQMEDAGPWGNPLGPHWQVRMTRAFLGQLDAYEARYGISPNNRSPAFSALEFARSQRIKGIPTDDAWPEWTKREMRIATICLKRFIGTPRAEALLNK